MKILFAIQGTGNGHLSRAREVVPVLQQYGEVHLLVSGCANTRSLPFLLDYDFRGLTFYPNANGGINYFRSLTGANPVRLFLDMEKVPVRKYDVVLSDFEPVSAWSCRLKFKKCIGLSHQSAVMHPNAPRSFPADPVAMALLTLYAPGTRHYGFHFEEYGNNIFTPVIRSEVRQARVSDLGHYTVYLPAYGKEYLQTYLGSIPDVQWEVFCKEVSKPQLTGNILFRPLSNNGFIESMANSTGVLCGAGFETPAEVLYLGKKLAVIPMKGQYEQQCNAIALEQMGVQVLKQLDEKRQPMLEDWLQNGKAIHRNYPDHMKSIVERILDEN